MPQVQKSKITIGHWHLCIDVT